MEAAKCWIFPDQVTILLVLYLYIYTYHQIADSFTYIHVHVNILHVCLSCFIVKFKVNSEFFCLCGSTRTISELWLCVWGHVIESHREHLSQLLYISYLMNYSYDFLPNKPFVWFISASCIIHIVSTLMNYSYCPYIGPCNVHVCTCTLYIHIWMMQ